jgi:putative MATE family efflux protein
MKAKYELTEGSIVKSLVRLAIPIMATSFVQMAYNMTDMIWLGRINSGAVAAAGTAGFFTWLAMAFILIPKIGAEVGIAQCTGRKDIGEARSYVRHNIQIIILLSLIYSIGLFLLRRPLIGFFNLGDTAIIEDAVSYLGIISFGIPFYFINPVFSGIFNGYGNSKIPFLINSSGLVINMFLDPVMILGIGISPMGVKGAALATIIAQAVVTLLFVYYSCKNKTLFSEIKFLEKPDWKKVREIIKLGLPISVQSCLFTVFAMIIARIISNWGPIPIAVQKVGSQIEALSWMTAGGFSTALSTFVGQNYGADKWNRIKKGYFTGLTLVGVIGIFATLLFILAARPIFSFFIPETEAIAYGVVYLRVLGFSQLFMCIEIATGGAFNGLGKTIPPSMVSIIFNAMRIPLALLLSSIPSLGLDGVWWSISISSMLKGIFIVFWFIIIINKRQQRNFELAC